MDDFELEIKQGFLEEATQLLEQSEEVFLRLETNSEDQEAIDQLFRLAHNLKGASRGVGFGQVAEFTHELENLLLKLKVKELSVDPKVVDVLLASNDFLKVMIEGLKSNLEETFDSTTVVGKIKSILEDGATSEPTTPEPPSQEPETPVQSAPQEVPLGNTEDQKDPFEGLEPVVQDSIAPNPPAQPKSEPDQKKASSAAKSKFDETIRVPLGRIEKLNNLVGEVVVMQAVLNQQRIDRDYEILDKAITQMSKITKEIQDLSFGLRLLPVKPTFMKMQRIARDTSKALNKKTNLIMTGENTEVDKSILEQLDDPLVHFVRNAIDHGLETNAERDRAGKMHEGNVWLRAFHEGSFLVIEIEDDGKGIDSGVIYQKAIQKGLIPQGAKLSDSEIFNLLFLPGFSTKEQVTEVSGRGVGLDVVRTNIEGLGGKVTISSTLGKGSLFRIELPLTLAIIDGMIAQVCEQRYVAPVTQVNETIPMVSAKVDFATGIGETLDLRGEIVEIIRLRDVLNIKTIATNCSDPTNEIAIISEYNQKKFAIVVDDILRQQQVVIKKLGEDAAKIPLFSGSAILGDGKPALILELHQIYKAGKKQKPHRRNLKEAA